MSGKLVIIENGVAKTPIPLPKEVFHCTMYDDGTSCYESSGISEQEIENAISAGKLVVCSLITMYGGDILTTELMASSVLGPYPIFTGTCRTALGLLALTVTYDGESSTAQQEWWSVERTYIPSGNTLAEPVTYSQLLSKISNSQLVTGKSYRITDYVTTTAQTNTSSAGHAFDLVVTAIDVNKLDCRASALLHSGDTYFSTAGADLSKWQIWYDVNNDTTKYAWAKDTNSGGKGVIYRMIDEWRNDCPYDFKNILYTKEGKYTSAYTFNKFANGDVSNSDHSLNGACCHDNVIRTNISNARALNFIVFLNAYTSSLCECNTFGNNCSNNTFGNNCSNNLSKGNLCGSTFGSTCINNTFESYCIGIKFGAGGQYNTIGKNCSNVTFGNNCMDNKIEGDCSYIRFGNSSGENGDYIQNVICENGNKYIRLFSTNNGTIYLKNVYIAQGCSGTSSAYTEISTIARNLDYRTTVGRDTNGNIRIYNEDEPVSSSPTAPGTLNTTNTTAQSTSSSEALSGAVNLHKVAKTGTYSDLIETPVEGTDIRFDSIVPYTYTQLDCLSNGTATALNTHVPVDTEDFEMELTVEPVTGSWYIFQSRPNTSTTITGITGASSGSKIQCIFSGTMVTSNITRTVGHLYTIIAKTNNGKITLYVKDHTAQTEDIVESAFTFVSSPYATTIWGNAANNNSPAGSKIHRARIWKNGVLAMDYIPVKRKSDNVMGFYDRVSKTLKTVSYGSVSAGDEITTTQMAISNMLRYPSFSNNAGKVLAVNSSADGVEWVKPVTIYSGSGVPSPATGDDGDIYIQTTA